MCDNPRQNEAQTARGVSAGKTSNKHNNKDLSVSPTVTLTWHVANGNSHLAC